MVRWSDLVQFSPAVLNLQAASSNTSIFAKNFRSAQCAAMVYTGNADLVNASDVMADFKNVTSLYYTVSALCSFV